MSFKAPKAPAVAPTTVADAPPPPPTAPTPVQSPSQRSFFSPQKSLGGTFMTGGQDAASILKQKTSGLVKSLGAGGST